MEIIKIEGSDNDGFKKRKLLYRIGTTSDITQLKELGQLAYGQFKNVLSEENWGKMNSFLSTINSYNDLLNVARCFVCEDGNNIVGMAFWVPKGNPTDIFDNEWSYIRMVGVNPNYNGHGIGKKLTQMCINFAKDNNEKIITLHTSEFMDKARYIYESLGFVKIKEIEPLFGKKYWLYKLEI